VAIQNIRSLDSVNIRIEHIGEEFQTRFSAFRETLTDLTSQG
jgi:hypothetical protein